MPIAFIVSFHASSRFPSVLCSILGAIDTFFFSIFVAMFVAVVAVPLTISMQARFPDWSLSAACFAIDFVVFCLLLVIFSPKMTELFHCCHHPSYNDFNALDLGNSEHFRQTASASFLSSSPTTPLTSDQPIIHSSQAGVHHPSPSPTAPNTKRPQHHYAIEQDEEPDALSISPTLRGGNPRVV